MKMAQIFHFTQNSQPVFTCSKSIRKTERHCAKYAQTKFTRKATGQMRETKFIIVTSLQSSIYHFRCYSMLFLPLYFSFHLDTLHRHPDSPFFLHFHLDSPHSRADSLHLHSHPIARIPTLILRISCIPFSNYQFWLLQIPWSVCIL